jgi:hypothetical protein
MFRCYAQTIEEEEEDEEVIEIDGATILIGGVFLLDSFY